MIAKITVVYILGKGIDEKLDKVITDSMIDGGFDWYAQGYDLRTKERDLCFEIEVE